ncbi:MAG: DUF2063 domain-containing protein [Candidatus Dadabacteria bacterium]|nr:MAG: DUF2063 domain-containing protein [Candidatus Dadabacteria bacterium]
MGNTSLKELQEGFKKALLSGNPSELLPLIAESSNLSSEERFLIYLNSYRSRMKEALENNYPNLKKLLGEKFFTELAYDYLSDNPSTSYTLRDFGDRLPQFLKSYTPLSSFYPLEFLSELALFEWLHISAFDGKESEVLSYEELKQVSPEKWPKLIFNLHPAVYFFNCYYNIADIWKALLDEKELPTPLRSDVLSYAIIWRCPKRVVRYRFIGEEEHRALSCVKEKKNFSEICEELASLNPSLEENEVASKVVEMLQRWVVDGLLKKG